MKRITDLFVHFFIAFLLILSSCTSTQKLSYLNNIPETGGENFFTMEIPDYKLLPRDVLYLTIKAMTPEGKLTDFLTSAGTFMTGSSMQGDAGGYLFGFDVNPEGNVIIPSLGPVKVSGLTLEEAKKMIQAIADKVFKNSTVECKLLSYKFTVIGEVKAPGAYVNYNNYLTILEAVGRAGGVGDYGDRTKVMVIRPSEKGTKTFSINLQDKNILSSKAYFLLPNDVVIVEPMKNKIFSMNVPTVSFILATLTSVISTTLLLINYLK